MAAEGKFGSKNQDGRFTRALRSSPLRLLGDEQHALHELPLTQPQGFTKSAASIFETLLASFDKQPPRLFSRIDEPGVRTAVDLSTKLSRDPNDGHRIVFRTAFGATEEMPIAALSYLLPSIRLAEELTNIQVNRAAMLPEPIRLPCVEFLHMNEAGVRINGLDRSRVDEQTSLFQRVAREYLGRFHPRVASSVSFLEDDNITPAVLRNPVFKLTELLVGFVGGASRRTLRAMAGRHGDGRGFRAYAALHPFIHEIVEKSDNSSALVSFGADSETTFYGLRKIFRPLLILDRQRQILPAIQYISSHPTPPYHMMVGGDISLSTFIQYPDLVTRNLDIHTPVRKALDQLFSDIGGKLIFRDFLKSL